MTQVLPDSPSRHRWPWSSRTSLGPDIAAAIALFIGEAAVFAWTIFGYGMENWAAQGNQDEIDATTLASISWTEHFLFVVLALAGLAALSRAPWTVVSHLLLAGIVAAVLGSAQHAYDRAHPAPAPTPRAGYSPCYSGSGTCG
ncbi:DUF6234 family protein [Streptomyces sp. NPDC005538]|uniref:DUF6234 family protein n=1 Tax=unclassified Streptomyces TaxID=2593676 RepID=UPI0033AEA0F4